jgi:protein phosphatase
MSEAQQLRRTAFGDTDVGRRRVSNEDAFGMDLDVGVFVVADGMGGHAAGEVASREAVDTVLAMVRREAQAFRMLEAGEGGEDVVRRAKRAVEAAMQAATYMVFALAETDPEHRGMGTTLSTLLVAGNVGITGQVGDSRIYRVRGGEVTRLTEDHTLVAWQIKQGIISPQEAERSPHRNVITRAVGSRDYVQVDTHVFELVSGDRFLLCSDGLHGYLEDHEIPPVLARDPGDAVRDFITLANQRGGRDNITAIVVSVD